MAFAVALSTRTASLAAPALRRPCASPRSLGTLRSTGLGCSPAQRKSAAAAAAQPPPPSSSRLPPAQAAAPWDRPSSSSSPISNQSITQQLEDLRRDMGERFDAIDGRLDSIEGRLGIVKGRLDKIEGIFNPSIWTVLRFLGNLILTASAVVIIVCSFLLIMRGGV